MRMGSGQLSKRVEVPVLEGQSAAIGQIGLDVHIPSKALRATEGQQSQSVWGAGLPIIPSWNGRASPPARVQAELRWGVSSCGLAATRNPKPRARRKQGPRIAHCGGLEVCRAREVGRGGSPAPGAWELLALGSWGHRPPARPPASLMGRGLASLSRSCGLEPFGPGPTGRPGSSWLHPPAPGLGSCCFPG